MMEETSVTTDERESENEDSWSDWEGENELPLPALCLFCPEMFGTPEAAFEHCKLVHHFDINLLQHEFALDCFSYIRLINLIRRNKVSANFFGNLNAPVEIYTDDTLLTPVLEDDGLLMYDIETADANNSSEVMMVDSSRSEKSELLEKLNSTEQQLEMMQVQLQVANEQMEKMRIFLEDFVQNRADSPSSCINKKMEENDGYFNSYAHFGIHLEMLQDVVRTSSYHDAIFSNQRTFEGKVVLDVGCGTGILSMFAAKAGASKVFAVDSSDIIYQAVDIVRENKLDNIITLLKDRVEDVELPVKEVDVIISEWMGYFLLFECMLDTVLYSRDHFLKPGGLMVPSHFTLNIVGISDIAKYKDVILYWENVYGFKMSCMKSEAIKESYIEVVSKDVVVTDECELKHFDMMTCKTSDIEFTTMFTLKAQKTVDMTALVGYFSCDFMLENKVSFSTSPFATPTHWKQTVFYLNEPLKVTEGEIVEGKISCSRITKDPRSLRISIRLSDKLFSYNLQ